MRRRLGLDSPGIQEIGGDMKVSAKTFVDPKIRDTMLILEVLGQNLFEPATVGDLAEITGLDELAVKKTMVTLRNLGYVRETKMGFQQSDLKVKKFDWRSSVYDDYIRDSYGKTVPFRGPDGDWYQRV